MDKFKPLSHQTKKERLEFDYSEAKKRYFELLELSRKKKCHCGEKTKEQWASSVNALQDSAKKLRTSKIGSVDTSSMEKDFKKFHRRAAIWSGHLAYAKHMVNWNPMRGESMRELHKQYGKVLYRQAIKDKGEEPDVRVSKSEEEEYTIEDWARNVKEIQEERDKCEMKAVALSREIYDIEGDAYEVLELANEYEAKAAYAFAMAQPIQPFFHTDSPTDSDSDDGDCLPVVDNLASFSGMERGVSKKFSTRRKSENEKSQSNSEESGSEESEESHAEES